MNRTVPASPYGTFNFLVEFGGEAGIGGFSDVSGLGEETTVADYRSGSGQLHPGARGRRVVLRRGMVAAGLLRACLAMGERKPGPGVTVTITLRDVQGQAVRRWILRGVRPVKWTGPTLAAKGDGDVAMEELVLTCEGLDPV